MLARQQYGVSQPALHLLPHIVYGGHIGDAHDLRQLLPAAVLVEGALKLDGPVEMVLDGPLAASGDDQDVVDARGHRLFDHILYGGLVHHWKHLLRLILGQWEKPHSQPRRRNYRLHVLTSISPRNWPSW